MANSAYQRNDYTDVYDVVNETPSGLVNGSNTVFTTASSFISGSVRLSRNGVRQSGNGDDYTETDADEITFTTAPLTGDIIIVDYTRAATSNGDSATVGGNTPSYLLDAENHTGSPHNPYCFSAYTTTASTLNDAAYTLVQFNAEDYDYNNDFNTTTYRYVAPMDGLYHLIGKVNCSTLGSPYVTTTALYVNGALARQGVYLGGSVGTGYASAVVTDIKLSTGDYVQVYTYMNSDGNETVAGTGNSLYTYFQGRLVHRL